MSQESPRTGDNDDVLTARLDAIGVELGRIHIRRLELMSEASDAARQAAATMTVQQVADRLGLPVATVRSLLGGV